MTNMSAPALMAAAGVAERLWSSLAVPASLIPGTTANSPGATAFASLRSEAADTTPPQPASRAAATRARTSSAGRVGVTGQDRDPQRHRRGQTRPVGSFG